MRTTPRLILALLASMLGCSKGGGGEPPGGAHSVLERNKHATRDGHFVQPLLTRAAAATMAMDAGFVVNMPGEIWASPLFLDRGPGGKGVFFVVTTANDVFALDETMGAVVWMRNIGPSPTANGVPCGGIHPLGIISTPVIDAASRTLFVAGAVGTTAIDRHEIHALSVDDGSERAGWPVDVSRVSAGSLTFTAPPQNQRSALSLVGGILYVAYGGHVGDCGPYRGWVVAVDTKDPARAGAWATGGQGEGIWAAGGMASDGNGVFAVTGNATSGTTTHLDSEQVVRITGLGTLDRAGNRNLFFPGRWRSMDTADADFGSSNPVYLEVPGATPSTMVMALSKDGHMYLLDSKNLGGMDGQVVDFPLTGGGVTFWATPTAYTTPLGVHVAFLAAAGTSMCPGNTTGEVVASVLIPPGAPPQPRTVWCAPAAGSASAIATTTDGKNDAIVWFMDNYNGRLMAFDGETGQVLFGGGAATCPGVHQWTSPIAVKGHIVVGANGHLCSWSPHRPDGGG